MFAILLATLPTQPNAVRLRVWRALKALGCAALRDGAYLLPLEQQAQFEPLVAEVREHGGTAMLLHLRPPDDAARSELLALFDRSDAYAQWRTACDALTAELPRLTEPEARRRLRTVAEALASIVRIDYYPGAAAEQAQAEGARLRVAFNERFAKGEPHAQAQQRIAPRDRSRYQGKTWATRARPWVDRLACAWLIRRFIDERPRFVWLQDPPRAPRGAIGFDYDGASFSHAGARVSFEVMLAAFGLERDAPLQRIAAAVHVLDVGGIPVPEAPGLEAVLAGLRELHADDDALLAAACNVFDGLYATPRSGA